MTEPFDPYRHWLAIPAAEQPANHYRLLGLAPFEQDLDAISTAAARQMALVRTFQPGPHSALSQKLLNELATARLCLLNQANKITYDAQLKARLGHRMLPADPEQACRRTGSSQASAPAQLPTAPAAPLSAVKGQDVCPRVVATDHNPAARRRIEPAWRWFALAAGATALLFGSWLLMQSTHTETSVALPTQANLPLIGTLTSYSGGDAAHAIDAVARPIVPGVVADRIVIWNARSDGRQERGARRCRLILLKDGAEVWKQENIDIPWSSEKDENWSIRLPQVRFDCVRVEIEAFEGGSGGLAEIEVYQADRNLARGCPAVASCILNPGFSAQKLTDGITGSSRDGVWLACDGIPGWAEVDLAFAERRTFEGVQADKLIVCNSHHAMHNDRGVRSVTVKLLSGDKEVWRQDEIEIPWHPHEDGRLEIPLPSIEYFDRVRIDVNRFEGKGGSLSEVEVLRGDKNLAAACPVQAGGCLSHNFRPQLVTDGIANSSQEAHGYWCSSDGVGGWLEIDLSCNCPEISERNQALGAYRALIVGDWLRGLPWLAQTADSEVRRAALMDASESVAPEELAALGDAWWNLAQNGADSAKAALLTRALFCYGRAMPSLPASERDRLRQRTRNSLPLDGGAYLCCLEPSLVEHVRPANNIYAVPVVVNATRYAYGIWSHPEMEDAPRIRFSLEGRYNRFHGKVAINDSAGGKNKSTLTFKVLADGKLLWTSQPIQASGVSEPFDIDIAGAAELELQVEKSAHFAHCHAVWLDPRLEASPSSSDDSLDRDPETIAGRDGVSDAKQAASAADLEAEQASPRVNVAVVRFEDKGTSVEHNQLGAVLAEMLAHDLGDFPRLRILERTASGELIAERSLSETGITHGGDSVEEKLAADYLVTGSCNATPGKLVVAASLTKVGSKTPVASWEHVGTVDDLMQFENDLIGQVSKSLDAGKKRRRKASAIPLEKSPTLAILPLVNRSPAANLDVMQEGFADILQASLGAIDGVRLMDRSQIESVLAEHKLSLSGLVDPKTAVQAGRLLQAQRLLVGSFLELGPNLNIHVRLVDADSGLIVASQRVSGPRDGFAQLLEDLALRILEDLSLPPVGATNAALKAALPARSMESAIHFAAAERMMSEGRHPQAAEAYRRVLLVEPGNITCSVRQLEAYSLLGQHSELQRAANQALGRKEFAAASLTQRMELLWILARSHAELNDYPSLVRVTDRITAGTPDAALAVNALRGNTLMRMNQYEAGVKLMQSAAPGAADPATDWKNQGLQQLFLFYAFGSNDWRAPRSVRTIEKTREACRRAMEICDRILVSASGKRDQDALLWARYIVPNLADHLIYVDEQGYNQFYLSPAERVDVMQRALKVFDWDPVSVAKGSFSLAKNAEEGQLWEQALNGYRNFLQMSSKLENVYGTHQGNIPSHHDSALLQPNTWVDQKIEAYYRLAKIQETGLKNREEAVQAYREMVREAGLANFRGADTVAAMTRLDVEPEYSDKCALVWGWDSNGQRSWERVLTPAGYKVHSLRGSLGTPAQLAPYQLIIVDRPGTMIFTPRDLLALRSYVGAGGSLLVIISPGWEPAAPSIHNGLLKFFDIEVGENLPTKVAATHIAAHPITAGITEATAKCGVALRAPPESVLISAGDNGLLVAREHRLGRVAAAAFGQWFLPEPSIFPGGWQLYRAGHVTARTPPDDLPFESGANLCQPLLNNVIDWLGERPPRGPEYDRWKQELAAAHWTAWRVHARTLDWSALTEAHGRLIAAAFDSVTREESLWAAGEANFSVRCFSQSQHLTQPSYGYERNVSQHPEASHYRQLIKLFPDSPLLHYAEWRIAECQRLRPMSEGRDAYFNQVDLRQAISAYNDVSAKAGEYPWAWARIRQGALAIYLEDHAAALNSLKEVIGAMPHGPERTLALAMSAECLARSGQSAEARRLFGELSSLPLISWDAIQDRQSEWHPVPHVYNTSRQLSHGGLTQLGKP